MLYLFFMLIILLPVFTGFGEIFQRTFGNLSNGIASKLLTGLLSVSFIFTVISFFAPLTVAVELSTVAVGLLAFFHYRSYVKFWDFFSDKGLSFSVIALISIFFAAGYPFILDHFGYFVPTVKWVAEFGLVRGISNLDLLLGQMSVWHILQAGFSHFSDPFLRINLLMIITYLIYVYENKAWTHLIFFPVLYFFIQSPSPDLPAIVLSLIILNEVLLKNKNYGLVFTLSVLVFAIKPTIVWLPLFVGFHIFFISKSGIKALFPGSVLLLLFLFKSIWVFGYPVFPVQVIDLDLSWKPNAELLRNSSEMAIQKTYDMQFTTAEIAKFSSLDYLKNWLFLDGIKGKIHLFFIINLLVFLVFAVRQKSKLIWLLFTAIMIKTFLVLVFSAQYRFLLDVFFVVFFIIFYKTFTQKRCIAMLGVLSLAVALLISFPVLMTKVFPGFKLGNFMTGFSKNQWYKPSYFELNKFKSYQIGNLKFNVVQNYPFSFDTPLPAISPQFIQEDLDAGIFPQMKGKSLKEGFIWKKITEEEKTQIRKILDEWAVENHD